MSGKYYPAKGAVCYLTDTAIDALVEHIGAIVDDLTKEQLQGLLEALESFTFDKEDFEVEEGDYYDDREYL